MAMLDAGGLREAWRRSLRSGRSCVAASPATRCFGRWSESPNGVWPEWVAQSCD